MSLARMREYMNTQNNISKNTLQNMRGQKVKIFDTDEMLKRKSASNLKSNVHQIMSLYLNFLSGTAGEIDLIEVNRSLFNELMHLVLKFPNFKLVIEFYIEQISLQLLDEHGFFVSDPVLIVGDAGVGKTAFCHALSAIFRVPFEVIGLSSATAGFIISGMSAGWADGKAGKIVECLAKNCVANPIILLDEIDKVSSDIRYDPLGSLYQLLEFDTAKNFVDEGLEVKVDCTYINWIATANSLDYIPEPILSRFTIFHISSPTKKEMKKVINSIYIKTLNNNKWGKFFSTKLSECAINKIIDSEITPRHMTKELKSACAKAAKEHVFINKKIIKDKFVITEDNIDIIYDPEKPRIGFI